jgi:2-polyprenyl-6-methoxyphenol hydroxylase-like FAD-dependent oxidoreductase
MDILISGMGIAGPTLAYWLRRGGHRPVVVEQAPHLRRAGYIIDFWGVGYDVADRMGLVPQLNEIGYFVKEVRLVDERGRRSGGFSADVFLRATNGRYVSLQRSELSAAIYDTIKDDVETLWDESITAITERPESVEVTFRSGQKRAFDLVIGADGLHSIVRRLCFGAETEFETYLGYKVAAFEVDGYEKRDPDVYLSFSKPGRQIARFSMRENKTLFLLVYRDDADAMPDHDTAAMKAELHRQFDGLGWECEEILAAMDAADSLYVDRVSQIRMPRWSKDRVCLVGDAAACPSLLAGEGAALAMVEAYILAGELRAPCDDPAAAFARYESRLRPFLARKQKSAAAFAGSFAPKTQIGLALRNLVTRAFDIPFVADIFLGPTARDDFNLPDYDWGGKT